MKKIFIAVNVIQAIAFALAFNFAYLHAASERDAYALVNQQGGVIIVNPEDGKKFISFRLKTVMDKTESPDFLAALHSLRKFNRL